MTRFRRIAGERGAVAVEFALLLPVLVLLVFGIFEFGRVYNAQISITNAAREGARYMAIHNNAPPAKTVAVNAAPSLSPALVAANVTVSPLECVAGSSVTVTVNYSFDFLTGYFGSTIPLTGKGVMQCGG
ncbi:TadE/TadG family type IV pilus assembly protein [Cryobacterium sp. TMS1-13-1]|uniref:TadE/TadG family type IV pilus assembly protein n=1 Tax=Cryobacterium sp. TMS1-13-1 TaxID=1259220 RepID=UPI0010695DA9|nr:TadE/TadG family type IV pilus assembly protein [Cryobacterium sp. TMS1-13-1]TFD19264.1 pilus assembly protein [Cryobacterium sp. TMS1-13-1]